MTNQTSQEKAGEIYDYYFNYILPFDINIRKTAKECAFKCVSEVIKVLDTFNDTVTKGPKIYWNEVKTHISNK